MKIEELKALAEHLATFPGCEQSSVAQVARALLAGIAEAERRRSGRNEQQLWAADCILSAMEGAT